jgi:hypothetical protein
MIKKKALASNELYIYIYDYTNIRKKTLFQNEKKNIQFNSYKSKISCRSNLDFITIYAFKITS